jgi:hypothetical protein
MLPKHISDIPRARSSLMLIGQFLFSCVEIKHIACQPLMIHCLCLSIRYLCIEYSGSDIGTKFRTSGFSFCRVRASVSISIIDEQ